MSSPTETSSWRLEWTDELSVSIPEIDAEHQRFIQLVNELNEAIVRRMDVAVIKKCMQAILDDAVTHFPHEEVLFKEWATLRRKIMQRSMRRSHWRCRRSWDVSRTTGRITSGSRRG